MRKSAKLTQKRKEMDEAVVFIVFKGSSFEFLVDPRRTTVGDLGIQVATKTDVLFETVKLTVPGRKLLKVAQEADSSLENAGMRPRLFPEKLATHALS